VLTENHLGRGCSCQEILAMLSGGGRAQRGVVLGALRQLPQMQLGSATGAVLGSIFKRMEARDVMPGEALYHEGDEVRT
jgi:hypothetical protein